MRADSSFEQHPVYATSRDVVRIPLYSGCETRVTGQVPTKATFQAHSSALCLGFGGLYNFILWNSITCFSLLCHAVMNVLLASYLCWKLNLRPCAWRPHSLVQSHIPASKSRFLLLLFVAAVSRQAHTMSPKQALSLLPQPPECSDYWSTPSMLVVLNFKCPQNVR